jgi:hypothetical protein
VYGLSVEQLYDDASKNQYEASGIDEVLPEVREEDAA